MEKKQWGVCQPSSHTLRSHRALTTGYDDDCGGESCWRRAIVVVGQCVTGRGSGVVELYSLLEDEMWRVALTMANEWLSAASDEER